MGDGFSRVRDGDRLFYASAENGLTQGKSYTHISFITVLYVIVVENLTIANRPILIILVCLYEIHVCGFHP